MQIFDSRQREKRAANLPLLNVRAQSFRYSDPVITLHLSQCPILGTLFFWLPQGICNNGQSIVTAL
jgi:hypothetical protein